MQHAKCVITAPSIARVSVQCNTPCQLDTWFEGSSTENSGHDTQMTLIKGRSRTHLCFYEMLERIEESSTVYLKASCILGGGRRSSPVAKRGMPDNDSNPGILVNWRRRSSDLGLELTCNESTAIHFSITVQMLNESMGICLPVKLLNRP